MILRRKYVDARRKNLVVSTQREEMPLFTSLHNVTSALST